MQRLSYQVTSIATEFDVKTGGGSPRFPGDRGEASALPLTA
jgi:hypothetical protein